MSLTKPHPIWSSFGSNPFQCHKAVITARMLSGRYLTDHLQRHWTVNSEGFCLLPACSPTKSPGTLEHILLWCTALHSTREKMLDLCRRTCQDQPVVAEILSSAFSDKSEQTLMQLLLDCTVVPCVIHSTQLHGTYVIFSNLVIPSASQCNNETLC